MEKQLSKLDKKLIKFCKKNNIDVNFEDIQTPIIEDLKIIGTIKLKNGKI
jgi:hypothetical protein